MSKRYLLPIFVAIGIVAACGSDSSTFLDGPGGSNGDGGGGPDLTGDNDGSTGGGPTDGALNADTACAQANGQAALKPLDMFIMFDRSISMGPGDCNVGQSVASPWCYAINALSAYLTSTSASGNAAALQFFGQGGGGAGGACSTGAGFNVSVVPGGATGYRELPSTEFNAALNSAAPDQLTPLEAAIRGITSFTGNTANQRAGRKTIGILITDASTPLDCTTNWSNMAGLLQTHFTSTGIPTYVIGMNGANFGNLETLAVAGGGASHPDAVGAVTDACGNGNGPCSHWNAGNGTSGEPLVEALKQIQGLAVGCSFSIPSPDGGTIDPNQVRVEYLPGGNPPAQELARVNDATACAGSGWYYDNNTTPQTVNLCGGSCSTVQADPNAKLNVLFGCVTGVPGVK